MYTCYDPESVLRTWTLVSHTSTTTPHSDCRRMPGCLVSGAGKAGLPIRWSYRKWASHCIPGQPFCSNHGTRRTGWKHSCGPAG